VTADYNSHENQEISVLTSKKARTRLKKSLKSRKFFQVRNYRTGKKEKQKKGQN
jgi:hypothetical protein